MAEQKNPQAQPELSLSEQTRIQGEADESPGGGPEPLCDHPL